MKKKMWKRTMQVLGFFIICVMALFSYKANQSKTVKFNPTFKHGALGICGEKPNCVSSSHLPSDPHFTAPMEDSNASLEEVDNFFSNCEKVISKDNYRHYSCETSFFKFIDDVEVYQDISSNTLFFRSASRVGHSDLGANSKRINALKSSLLLNK